MEVVQNKILSLIGTYILITIVLPIALVVVPIMYLIRISASVLSKIMRPDLEKMLTACSSFMSIEDVNGNATFIAFLRLRFKGLVDIEALKSKLVNEVIGIRKVEGELKNIQLKQYPVKWMGFFFWKYDEDFDISNHVKYYESDEGIAISEEKISAERISEIEHELLFKPFPKNRSPWEFIFFPNVQSSSGEDETIIIFRIHHSLADAYSLLKLFAFEICDQVPKELIPKVVFPKKSVFERLAFFCKCIIGPYLLMEAFVDGYDRNDWRISEKQMKGKWIFSVSESISTDVIKDVHKKLNYSVSAIIFAAVTASLRKAMLKKNGRVPKHINTGMVLPMKHDSEKLQNSFTVACLQLPVGEPDPVRRVRLIERNLENLKKSVIPGYMHIVLVVIGSMFYFLQRPIVSLTPSTSGGSTFPGPKTALKLFGVENFDCYFAMTPMIGNMGVHFTTLTYNGQFKTRFMVNENILNKKSEVEQITKDVIEEIHILNQ